MGFLNLQVGSWLDALRRLSEGAALAQDTGDTLWQARAIEGLLVAMLLLAWKSVQFEMPVICQRAYRTSQLMAPSFNTSPAQATTPSRSDEADTSPLREWFKYAPAVAHATIGLYSGLALRPDQRGSIGLLRQSRLRLFNILILLQQQSRVKVSSDLTSFVLGQGQDPSVSTSGDASLPLTQITNGLLELVPSPDELASDRAAVTTLTAILACLTSAGSGRRLALVLTQLLQPLALALSRARKVGASEIGVHPPATVSANGILQSNEPLSSQDGFRSLLQASVTACGADVDFAPRNYGSPGNLVDLAANLNSWYKIRLDGDLHLKLEVLRLCIDVAEALPDLAARMILASTLLRSALGSLTVSPSHTGPKPALSPQQQGKTTDGLRTDANTARRLGVSDALAEYWDDFLVRDIEVYQPPEAARLTSHTPHELSAMGGQSDTNRDPFIFNPFAKGSNPERIPVMVTGELVTFSVLLQNPLEVEVEIDSIQLVADGCDFQPSQHSMVLGRYCSQPFSLTGRARSSGELKISGCKAVVAGCQETFFRIFKQEWRPPHRNKFKPYKGRNGHECNETSLEQPEIQVPDAQTLLIKVIDSQPQLQIVDSSLSKPSLMLLDGEKRTFELTLRNKSEVLCDFLLFSHSDNVTAALSDVLSRKDLSTADTYEVQHQMKHRPTVEVHGKENESSSRKLLPGAEASYKFSVFGRPGLLEASVQIDFAYLGVLQSELTQSFYTRHTSFPVAVTVNGAIDMPRCNILPVGDDFVWPPPSQAITETEAANGTMSNSITMSASASTAHCMLSLDLRNVWPQPLTVNFTTDSKLDPPTNNDAASSYTVQEILQPGQVTRIILMVPRIFVQDPYTPIPNLITQRQFVVSASKLSLEAEAASRENFWYREELLKCVKGSWREEKSGRYGDIDVRKGIKLSSRMIDVLKIDHVDISFSVEAAPTSKHTIKQVSRSHFSVPTEGFAKLIVRIQNSSKEALSLLLRLQPALRDQPHNIALDLSRRFAWSGALQQAIYPPIEPGDIREASLGIIALAEGNYEINATVEEIRGRARADTSAGLDGIGMSSKRRIWHARAPCLIDSIDE